MLSKLLALFISRTSPENLIFCAQWVLVTSVGCGVILFDGSYDSLGGLIARFLYFVIPSSLFLGLGQWLVLCTRTEIDDYEISKLLVGWMSSWIGVMVILFFVFLKNPYHRDPVQIVSGAIIGSIIGMIQGQFLSRNIKRAIQGAWIVATAVGGALFGAVLFFSSVGIEPFEIESFATRALAGGLTGTVTSVALLILLDDGGKIASSESLSETQDNPTRISWDLSRTKTHAQEIIVNQIKPMRFIWLFALASWIVVVMFLLAADKWPAFSSVSAILAMLVIYRVSEWSKHPQKN